MFELGLRLAYDKPTAILKDDRTDYSFDTGIIEHIPYPRDLRFGRIVELKRLLSEKIKRDTQGCAERPGAFSFLEELWSASNCKSEPERSFL